MTQSEREIIELKMTGMNAIMKANHDIQMIKLESMLTKINSIECQTLKTNGRVSELEKETRMVRMLERKPILLILIAFGIFVLYGIFDFAELIKFLR